jgi:hypothetical protein
VQGTTVQLSTGILYVAYQMSLGQMVLGVLLLAIIVILVMRWIYDAMY